MSGYMMSPLDLTERQMLIYMCLYKKCNFQNMQVDMTVKQVSQAITIVDLSEKVVYLEIQKMIKSGYISMIRKGTKGISPIYQIQKTTEKVGKSMGSQWEVNGKLNSSDFNGLSEAVGSDREVNGKELGDTIQRKGKRKDIYIDAFTEIYNLWNDKKIIVHKGIKDLMVRAYKKALKEYRHDEIVKAINNYAEVLESDFYYSNRFTLENFLKQKNGISTFIDDGQNYVNYLVSKKTPSPKGAKEFKNNNYSKSICNNQNKNTQEIREHKFK